MFQLQFVFIPALRPKRMLGLEDLPGVGYAAVRHEGHDGIDCLDGAPPSALDFDAVGVQDVQDPHHVTHV